MDHSFIPSQIDVTQCAKCHYDVISHTTMATCEVCSNSGNMEIFTDMLLCSSCIEKEIQTAKEYQSPELQESRLNESKGVLTIGNLVDKARAIDYSIQVRTDIHNAKTLAIEEVKKSIIADSNIAGEQKQFEFAKYLTEHFTHLQKVAFEHQEAVVNTQNEIRVVQQTLNQLANSLRAEEREKLKILSPNYKPGAVKAPAKPRVSKKITFNKIELITEAKKLQDEGFSMITWSMLQMTCVSRNMTPSQAADVMRKTLS